MSDKCKDTLHCSPDDLRHAMSVHTRKITDACRDKDCIEDLRVYLTRDSQELLDHSGSARIRSAELLLTRLNVEPVTFDRSHYCVDATFYYRICGEVTVDCSRPVNITGLAVFSKRAVLCGEDGRTHIYTSEIRSGEDSPTWIRPNRPTAVVEALDPMILGSKVKEVCHCCDCCNAPVPAAVKCLFDGELVWSGEKYRLFVSLGQFSIIRLERDAQLVVPVLDYAIPTKECSDGAACTEDPCEMFSRIPFPAHQFAPNECDRRESHPGNDGCDCCGKCYNCGK